VDDGRVDLPHDRAGKAPARGHRERRDGKRLRPQADVRLEGPCIAEHVPRRHRRIPEQVEVHAAFERRPREARVPRQHEVHLVPAIGDAPGDRLHERADEIAGE
jgi:hypothetical protein